MIEDDDPLAVEYTKIHDAYTNPEKATAFGSPINLARATNCSLKHVNRYLNSSETYTKFKLTRKRFPRLEDLKRLWKFYGKCGGFRTINLPMQNLHSNLCGLYCLYLVH